MLKTRVFILLIWICSLFVCGCKGETQGESERDGMQVLQERFADRNVFELDSKNGAALLYVVKEGPQDAGRDFVFGELYLSEKGKKPELIEKEAVSAKFLNSGEVLYTARGELAAWNGKKRTILEGVESDFAVSPDEKELLSIEYNPLDETSRLISSDLQGRARRVMSHGDGQIMWPYYTPDGKWILFVAAFDGVASWYRVASNDPRSLTQITNRGLEPGPDVLSEHFIPVPQSLDTLEFVGKDAIRYETGEGQITLDFMTGKLR